MDALDPDFTRHRVEIPPMFHASSTGAPFHACVVCHAPLRAYGTHYVIEKAIRRYPEFDMEDTVFEYAMCLACYEQMQQAMSEESLRRVQDYFLNRVDLDARRQALFAGDSTDPANWISHCLVTGAPRESFTEYQIFCQCDGGDLLFTHLPYLIGGPTIDEVAQLLSNKTLGEIDGFMDRHFGLPPELRKKLMDRPLVMV
ncbi:MAG: hypothetical protein R2834_07720 [Rhodothermales bacterium]